ncbi:hypothetical protein FRB99_002688, partial [Tulasnella sp. 403]
MARLCPNYEGWGPVSKERPFDFTPCFEDGVLVGGPLAIILLGSVIRTFQLRSAQIQPKNAKTRHWLATKLFASFLCTLLAIVALVLTVFDSAHAVNDEAVYVASLRVLVFPAVALFTRSNHTKTRRSSTLLLLLWPIYICTQILGLRTYLEIHRTLAQPLPATLGALTALTFVALLLECNGPERSQDLEDRENPYVISNVYSRLAYSWMTPLMRTGASRFIKEDDMYELLPDDQSKELGEKLQNYWDKQKNKNSWALWRALAHAYGAPYAFAGFLKVLQDLLAFAQPQLLRLLLAYITAYQTDQSLSRFQGVALTVVMFVAALVQTSILHQYFYLCFLTGMRIRAGLITTVYKKALVLSNDAQGSRGDIVNLMSVDATRMQDLTTYGLIFVSGPFQ